VTEAYMRIALITDTFPPLRSSGSVQLRDLSREFVKQGHEFIVLLPWHDQIEKWRLEDYGGVKVLFLKAPKTKDVSYFKRTIAEVIMPFAMRRNLKLSPLLTVRWDAILWYSPSIFHGPFVSKLKGLNNAKSYLIIRDVFPEWALDMGLLRRGIPYLFFKMVAKYQYSVADVIGVQTPGNLSYFESWVSHKQGRKLEVLKNWLDKPANLECSIRVNKTALAGRFIFVYAGNMGVAQGMDVILQLVDKLNYRTDIGFLLVGRGSEVADLKQFAKEKDLRNIEFFDEIDPDEIPDLYSQCSAGIVALDPRHKSHNIPGKFITYMQSGLPVLANLNSGNDLIQIIRDENVGQVCDTNNVEELMILCDKLIDQVNTDRMLSLRCKAFFNREFAVENTVKQIVKAVSKSNVL
jgi:glycosyltransferase involved in cell wall biosynthesis